MMLEFRKSSYSSSGDNCVEVAPILTFRKSSYSTGGENCVEVTDLPTGVAIRDSQNPEPGFLPLDTHEWTAFARLIAGQALKA